jgi:glycosyltransferase involved in cell wall biosynthesis
MLACRYRESNDQTTTQVAGMTKPILFIGHAADVTGAPIILLHFLRWFKTHSQLPFQVLLKRGGPLEHEFRALAPVMVLSHGLGGMAGRRLRWLGWDALIDYLERPILARRFAAGQFGLIYSNTVANGGLLNALAQLNAPVISHVHELQAVINSRDIGPRQFNLVKTHTDHFIAVSQAVKENLVRVHAIPADRVTLAHEFIPSQPIGSELRLRLYAGLRSRLGLPANALIVGGGGTTSWRKAPDLFVNVAQRIRDQLPNMPVYFVWIGGHNRGWRFYPLHRKIAAAHLASAIRFLGTQANPLDFFAGYDVLALTSREDPFPLVMLEAASVGTPIACFDGAGGAKEFVEDDSGRVVPYLDTEAMASAIVVMLKSPELRQKLGAQAQLKVAARHTLEHTAPRILDVIHQYYQP